MCYIRNQIGGIKVLERKIEEIVLATNIKPGISKSQVKEFAKKAKKELSIALLIISVFPIIGMLIGAIVETFLGLDSIPCYILGIFPLITGTIGGSIIYYYCLPRGKALVRKYLGS
jgi:hypothetical protein